MNNSTDDVVFGEETRPYQPPVLPKRTPVIVEKKGVGATVGKILGTLYRGPSAGVIGERVGMTVEKKAEEAANAAKNAGKKLTEKKLEAGDLDGPTMDLM